MKKIEEMGFKKARSFSNVLYVIAGVLLVYKVMFLPNTDPLALPVMAVAILFFCLGIIVYSKGCRCPKCGKIQPRYNKERCVDCQAELDPFITKK